MGLMDILEGMQNGPRGRSQPAPPGAPSGSKGMSPLMMALLALLAYKAIKGGGLETIFGRGSPTPAPTPTPLPPGTQTSQPPGSLEDLLGGIFGGQRPAGSTPGTPAPGGGLGDLLGGLLGGAAAGTVLNGGLGNIIKDLQTSGQGKVAQSWVGLGDNEPIDPGDLEKALGADTIQALSAQTGLPRQQLLAGLSETLPDFVDRLTPDGRLPTNEEATRW